MATFATQSASLNGSTQGFSAADNASTSPTGDMTCEAWVKLTAEPGVSVEYDIMSKHDNGGGANGRSFTMTYLNNAGTLQFTTRISSDGTSANQTVGTLNHTFGTGTWHHIAFSYTASTGTIVVVKNGTSLGSITGHKTSIFDSTTALTIGIRGDLTSASLNGRIGTARLWKGVARTAAQINADICTTYGCPQTNLSGEWSLNNVLTDSSGNANTLTNVGTATFSADVTSTCPLSGISFDSVSIETNNNAVNTGITGNTINVGTGCVLYVAVLKTTGSGALPSLAVTYNGTSMTQIGSVNTYMANGWIYLFELLAPTTGSAIAPIATWSSTDGAKAIHAISYRGADTTNLSSNTQNSSGAAGTTGTGTITIDSKANSWSIWWGRNESNTWTAGTNSFVRAQVPGDASAWFDSNGTVPVSAGYTQTGTWTGAANWGMVQIEVSPPVTVTSSSILALMGVG